jgi:hypothetical protein
MLVLVSFWTLGILQFLSSDPKAMVKGTKVGYSLARIEREKFDKSDPGSKTLETKRINFISSFEKID